MIRSRQLPQFEKDLKHLRKKYPSIPDDLARLEKILEKNPIGIGAAFAVLQRAREVEIVKARLACRSLRDSSLRVVYAFHKQEIVFVYIELYYKGNKEREDVGRIQAYIQSLRTV